MSDYSDFFTNVVAKHLHRLVDLVKNLRSKKVLVHEWVVGIERNWSIYVTIDASEFIPRLSFRIGGLRDQFNSNPTKNKVIDLLYETFDASTFCYFDYDMRDDVERQIENYCKEVDEWFSEDILTPKLEKFRLSKEVIPLINDQIDILQRYGSDLSGSKNGISKEIKDALELEKEFLFVFKTISEKYVESMSKNIEGFSDIKSNLESFEKSCNKLGYKDVLSKKLKSEIEEINKKIILKNLIADSISILKGTIEIDKRIYLKIINQESSISNIQQKIADQLSTQIIESLGIDITQFNKNIKDINSVIKLWENNSITLLNKKQKSEIEETGILIETKKALKSIVHVHFEKIKLYAPELPEPQKYSPFVTLFSNSLTPIKSDEILLNLYELYMNILKRNPKDGSKILENIKSFTECISNKYSVKQIKDRFNELKDTALLKIRVINLFRRSKARIQVVLKHNSKKINSKRTDETGEVIFEGIPKDELKITVMQRDKEKEYNINIQNYYNEKEIWLFSI